MNRFQAAFAALFLACLAAPAALAEEPLLPVISQVYLYPADPVKAAQSQECGSGLGEFAVRDNNGVRNFESAANRDAYAKNPGKFPDIGEAEKVAFWGDDLALFFTGEYGVFTNTRGAIVAGDPNITVRYKGATFRFAYEATRLMFLADPARYVPAIGGYCPGAMAGDHVTPGDPHNAYYIPEAHVWGIFGSPQGPIAWKAMTSAERSAKYAAARANYERRTGLASASDKVAAR